MRKLFERAIRAQKGYTIPKRGSVVIPIKYESTNPCAVDLWVKRDKRWVATVANYWNGLLTAIRVTDDSNFGGCTLSRYTAVAFLAERGHISKNECWIVRPGSARYEEWEVLSYEL